MNILTLHPSIQYLIFSIFENGVDIDAAKLYPAIEFPVSRGTPMISSLIKWDHSEDRFVTRYEAKSSKSERLYTVNISDQEYEFVTGHTIDGKFESAQISSRAHP